MANVRLNLPASQFYAVWRHPKAFDWGRFTTYASFVLSAKVDNVLLNRINDDIPTLYLFPRLRSLTLILQDWGETPFTSPRLDIVFPPTLENLNLRVNGGEVLADVVLSLCDAMTSRQQPLKDFSVETTIVGDDVYAAIIRCIKKLPLRKFALESAEETDDDWIDALLLACRDAEGLIDLSIDFTENSNYRAPGLSGTRFNHLQKLSLDGNIIGCAAFLPLVTSPSLQELKFMGCNPEIWEAPLRPLQDIKRFGQLRTLFACVGIPNNVSWDDIESLTACSALEFVQLELLVQPQLTPLQLSALAEAWPNLQSFTYVSPWNIFNHNIGSHVPSSFLNDLQCFSKYCPMLSSLTVVIDTETLAPEPPEHIHSNPVCLTFLCSTIGSEPQLLARRIASMWPKLRSFDMVDHNLLKFRGVSPIRQALEAILDREIPSGRTSLTPRGIYF
ncbi:hypothetical protein FRB99_001666 [Tulasnella sp. 403]|nr:hypothetical protein FRB99_001666 [Tulasnella sp. 403]